MDGFNEDDSIPSFNASALIEEVDEDDDTQKLDEGVDGEDIADNLHDTENEDDNGSSSDSYDETYRTAKRFKSSVATGNLFKMKVMKILKESCEVAGDFAISGKLDRTPLLAISLKNKEGGPDDSIKFPLSESEVTKIMKYFEPSPYGRGAETVVDPAVRNSFQLSPDGFEILNSDWDKFIKVDLVNHIKKQLSLDCSFVASMYKLLLYQPGSFFKCHRDSEKEDNMFGTLVVQLPSKFKGGQLVVRHDGKTKLFDFSSMAGSANNTFSTFFSAFYCDCEHEILKITEGYRFSLVYNLIAVDTGIPAAPQNRALEVELIELLQNWEGSRKLVYALTHKYSESGLSFTNMKTTDKIVANILLRASVVCELNIFLAMFDKECSGDGDGYGDEDASCRGCASDYDGDFDGECDDISYKLKAFISSDRNEKINLSYLSVDFDKEVIPTDSFDSIDPYQQNCEHTGNEGVHITKSYRRAALTIWPKAFTFRVLKSSNAATALMDTFFIKETEKYFENNSNAEEEKRILEWAKFIVSHKRYHLTRVLDIVATIIKFNDIGLIQKLIPNGVVRSPEAFALIVKECEKFGWEHFATSMVEVIKHSDQKYAIKVLNMFIGDGNLNPDKCKVFHALIRTHFDKGVPPDSYHVSSAADKIKQQKDDKELLEPLVNVVLRLNDLQLIQNFVKFMLPLHSETMPLLAATCENYGWQAFATFIGDKFKKKSKKDQISILTSLIQTGFLNDDKKSLCGNLFGILFDKNEEFIQDPLHYYNRTHSHAEIIKRRKDERELLEPLINATSAFKDVQLLKNIFQRMTLHSETIPLLIAPNQFFGWSVFAMEIGSKFERLSQIDAIDTLSVLIGIGNFKEEKGLCFNLFQIILDKTHTPQSNNLRSITHEEQSKYLREKQHILHSICCMAENIKFTLMAFAQRQSFKDFVPVLLMLAQKESNRLSTFWTQIATHFIAEMGKELSKPIEISWKHCTDSLYACCNDCTALSQFVGSNKERESFRMGDQRRKHLQHRVNLMRKLSHTIEIGRRGQVGALVVTKIEKNANEMIQTQHLCKVLLLKLQTAMQRS